MTSARTEREDARRLELQRSLLAGVSRTFALTIPALPGRLADVVGNAYLLCRVADCIEDVAALDAAGAAAFGERLIAALSGRGEPGALASDLAQRLAARASAEEHRLIDSLPEVLAVTATFGAEQRAALGECVAVMARGMAHFQKRKSAVGLADLEEHARYCYVVAGCVGEMLTRLFIEELPELGARRAELMRLSVSFGQCLQMTNILKDFWEDRAQGACWLPCDVFGAEGVDLAQLRPGEAGAGFARGYRRLIGLARKHAENALAYALAIPPEASGVRNFCLWALFMALLTQRKLLARPGFRSGAEVKIGRPSVRLVVAWCRLAVRSDRALRASFALLARGLPQARREDLASPATGASRTMNTELVP